MALALVNNTTSTADDFTDGSSSITIPQTTVGNLIVVCVTAGTVGRTISSISGGATFSQLHRKNHSGGGENGWVEIQAGIATSQVTTVTVTLSGNDTFGSNNRVTVLEFSGASDPLAESGTSVDNEVTGVTAISLATVACDAADTLFIAAYRASGTLNASLNEDADFTSAFTPAVTGVAYRIQNASSTAQGYAVDWNGGTSRSCIAALVGIQGLEGGGAIALPWFRA